MTSKNPTKTPEVNPQESVFMPSYQQLVENALEGIWVVDANLHTTYVNHRLCELLGYTSSEMLGKPISLFLFEKDLADFSQKMLERHSGKQEIFERRFKHKNNSAVWMLVSAKSVFDDQGRFAGSFANLTDITEKIRRERNLQVFTETQSLLSQMEDIDQVFELVGKKIYEVIPEGIVGITAVDEINEVISIKQLFRAGKLYDDMVEKFKIDPTRIKYPIKDAPADELAIFQSGTLLKFEGGLYPLLMRKIPKSVCKIVEKQLQINEIAIMGLVSEGRHFGGVAVLTKGDISPYHSTIESIVNQATQVCKRLRSEKTKQLSEDRLKKTFEAIEDGYWDWDIPSGQIVVNDKWYTMLGYKPGEFPATHENYLSLLHPDDRKKTMELVDQATRDFSTTYSAEFRLKMKSGEYKYVLSRGKVISTNGVEKPVRMVGTHSDISDRKKYEQDRLLFYETQRKLLQAVTLEDLYKTVGEGLTKLLPGGYSVFTRFDEAQKVIKVVGFYGFGVTLDDLFQKYRLSSSSFDVRIEDIEQEQLNQWEANALVPYTAGLYGILTKKVPKVICKAIEKQLSIKEIFVMGCQWNQQDYGGFVLLTKNGLGMNKELIETLINDTAIAIQRILVDERSNEIQNRYRSIFEESPVGILTVGPDLKMISANTEFCNFIGYSQNELLGMTFKEFTHPDHLANDLENVKKLVSDEIKTYNTVKRYIHKSGISVWGRIMLNKIVNPRSKDFYLLAMVTDISSEMMAEELIMENQRFLEIVLDTIPNFVFVRDIDGRYRLANKAFADAMGMTPQELIGTADVDLPDRLAIGSRVKLQDGEVIRSQKEWFNPDIDISFPKLGVKTVQFVKRPLPDTKNKKPALLGVMTDISMLKQIEKELRASESRYRTLIQNTPAGVYQTDEHGSVVYLNERICNLAGLSYDEMTGSGWLNAIHPDDREQVVQRWHAFIKSGGKWSMEYRILNQKMEVSTWVYDEAVELLDEAGKRIGFIGSKVNLSEQKTAEDRLKKSEEKYRLLTENMKDVIWTLDTETMQITYMSPSIEKLRGYTVEEVMSQDIDQKLFNFDTAEIKALIKKQITEFLQNPDAAQKYYINEFLQSTKDGNPIWVEIITNYFLNPETGHVEMKGVSRDITDRKKAELERQSLFEIMQGLGSSKDLHEFLVLIHHQLSLNIDARNIGIVFYHKDTGLFEEVYAVDEYDEPYPPAKLEKGLTSYIFRTGKPAIIRKKDFLELKNRGELNLVGTMAAAWMGAPLKEGDETIGVISVQNYKDENCYTEHDKDFLTSVASQVTIAINRKRAEEALQKSEEKHRMLIENSHDIIYTINLNGEITFLSNAWSLFLGYPTSKIVGQSFSQLMHKDDRKGYQNFINNIITSNTRQSGVEYRVKHVDGTWRWHTSSAVPILNESGRCIGIEGTARDITDQKLAEAALSESEERYRALVEYSPVAVMLAQRGKFIYSNQSGLDLFGFQSIDDIKGKNILQFIHNDSKRQLLQRILDIRRNKPNSMMPIKILRKNGESCETESISSLVKINGVTTTLIFAQDVSSRREAEEKIRKNTEELTFLKRLNDSVNRGDSLEQSIGLLTDETKVLFAGNGAAVYLLDEDRRHLELQNYQIKGDTIAWVEKKIGIKIPKTKIKLTPKSIYQQILSSKKLHYIEGPEKVMALMAEFTDNPAYKKMIPTIYKRLGIYSVICIPLLVHNESVGLLEFSSNTPFNPESLERLEFISSELGSIIRRKQAEESLKVSEDKFRQIVERSNDMFIRQDFETLRLDYISPKVIDLLGYTQQEMTGLDVRNIDTYIHPDDLSKFHGFREELVNYWRNGDKNLVIDFRLQNKQGEYKWFTGNYSLVMEDNETPRLIMCTLSDITTRKQNEQTLRFRVNLMQLAPKLSLNELLVAILDEVETITDSQVGFFHFVDQDETNLSLKAWSTNTTELTNKAIAAGEKIPDGQNGIWQECLKQRRPLIQNEEVKNKKTNQNHGEHTRVKRQMIVPVVRNDKIVSILGIGNKSGDYTLSDLEMVSKLADLAWDIVENKKIESALQESEAIFSAFMENSPIYVFFKDKEIRSKQLSRNYEQMLGRPLESLLNKTMDDLFPSDLAKSMIKDDQRILSEGKTVVVEEELNGRYYTTIKFPILRDGVPEFLAGFTIDITDRVISERKLAESEEMYRLISSVVSDYLFSSKIDAEDRLELQWVAGAFEAMTGYTLAEYKEMGGWRAALHPDDYVIDDQDLNKLRQNHKVISEVRTLKKDGSMVWVRVYSQPIWDEEKDRLVGINGAVQDITERKKAEEEIRKSAMEFEALYDTARDFSMHRDPLVILRTIVDRAATMFGTANAFVYLFDPDENDLVLKVSRIPTQPIGLRVRIGEGISGLVAEKLEPMVVNDYASWSGQLPIFESATIAAVMCVPMLYGGQLIGVLGVHEHQPSKLTFNDEDVHFLSLFASQAAGAVYSADLFEKLRQNATELEKRVDDRTLELKSKNKELETFTYTVSHDLKAPLRGISGYATLLMEDHAEELNEEGKRYLGNLVSSTERMSLLIEDLLAYSRVERREIKKTTVNLNEMIEKIIAEYQTDVNSRNLQFKLEIRYDELFTDHEALSQALRNIIDNAVKFTRGRETPQIFISCGKLEDHCLISVEDNGIGFDMKYYDKIFEIFQRLHLSEEYPGTGVGLAVVRKAIERLGGKIWAVSEPGEGSTFFMELPL